MFRLSHYLDQLYHPTPPRIARGTPKPVVIWNLTRRCNLKCKHCYTVSADVDFPGELTAAQARETLEDIGRFKVPALILSGGEPLLRDDLFALAKRARALTRVLALSTNGTGVIGSKADRVAEIGFDYVGISIDGIGATNDAFRGVIGAYEQALAGVRSCKRRGIKVGLRFTITEQNESQLPELLKLCDDEGVDKFYLSHLVYAGRGNKNRGEDADHARTRRAMDLLIARALESAEGRGHPLEIVTGNNDADAVYFLNWAKANFPAAQVAHLRKHLEAWGGNASGVGVANIDTQGDVHPDTYWSEYTVGSVKQTPFSELWTGPDPMLAELRRRPRPLKGRCGACAHQAVCGGNTRIRALQLTGDPWAEDPACYLTAAETGTATDIDRLTVRPFIGDRHDPKPAFV
ncbi:putative nitrite reductase heme biosynthesis J protein [Dinoroseobacter shibae DFL 12 = DSM 16493]|jgi:heme d1 biosynthesis radical SAM protein NirJ|uniref:Pre-heme d1 synthase n=1 Tax=Dinoroseobacter shibae (strain DSM 16493 / NCIMB 14021 / DFL 12) TaxID=398580 RepID=NIRJ_DINSH|nr:MULTISPECIES: heme d1 biosynthesis radical SAM protein NirJ [Dinoroseobacter]A8LLZ7.1 RecName: Full=Pre-heme d1 synthase [Dinoroseobacter shibae DFL 12 = DSM 16493]ABV94906.1 putative nitrite reductase heme biosynthesis J protein [Dinoroseobacter shibae DFL 12 = DSM 16493]MDD9717958.1 heme d1 biosynthesis radical SAM protein NirJ [Dinoroseobacter sp. PD6]URF46327.1 heme d1 biosynthesis radical SAM protein NirJ [Dinoroseobacter shibae]URF50633.1 heme d1 biosynthesis radical SAM protein NirJ 